MLNMRQLESIRQVSPICEHISALFGDYTLACAGQFFDSNHIIFEFDKYTPVLSLTFTSIVVVIDGRHVRLYPVINSSSIEIEYRDQRDYVETYLIEFIKEGAQ
jgi:hypothetical protein